MMFLIGWVLLTLPVWIAGTAIFSIAMDGRGPISRGAKRISTVFVLPTWWGIYFLVAG